ncbi:MAG: leucine-rich repeat protein [Oscillospiraceae bacterium]
MVQRKSSKAVSFFLVFAMILTMFTMFSFTTAHAEKDGEWEYETIPGGVNLITYIGTDTSVTIPAKLGGLPVIKVSRLCGNFFKDKVVSVTIPEGVREIGDGAFQSYTKLEKVSLPESLTSIGQGAFFGCISLKGVNIPSNITSLGLGAFEGCSSLQSINLTSKLTEIPERTFSGCTSLNTVTLPIYLTSIGKLAFGNCSSLPQLSIPDSVTKIEENAFYMCTKLAKADLPSELKTLGECAFGYTAIKTAFLNSKIKYVSSEAFNGCSNLEDVYISSSIVSIGQSCFKGCVNLKKVVFSGDYINIEKAFDTITTPVVYYPTKYATGWASHYATKKVAYEPVTTAKISGKSTLAPGDRTTLTVTLAPKATDFSNVYSIKSSNTSVATVTSDNIVTARSAGTTVITVTSLNGVTATFNVKVTPKAVTDLKAIPKSTVSIDLSWTGTGASNYIIYRSTSKSGSYKKVDTTSNTSFTDKGLTKGKKYYYKVVGYYTSDGQTIKSGSSNIASASATAPTPTTIKAAKAKSGSAKITWSKSTGATGYEIYMASSKNGTYKNIKTVTSASTVSYTKTGLTKGKTYYFKVRAYVTVNGKKVYSPYTTVVSVKV